MDSHNYAEYAFWLGSLSYDELLDECERQGVELWPEHANSDDLRSILLSRQV